MGRFILSLAVLVGGSLAIPGNRACAQVFGTNNDPFTLYFGYYLPHQAAVAAQSTPLDTINAAQAARQVAAAADRTGLYDPTNPYEEEDFDPTRPYRRPGRERLLRPHTFSSSTTNHRMRGVGAGPYYGRTSQYYPTLRPGMGPNRNLSVARNSRYSNLPTTAGLVPAAPSMAGPR